ncbi:ABC transporter ATP-binding protein [Alteromonas sp. IB21]|uniref:ABC transporter ATP-binding protein n=1 Tax=Alteromonas sp. IB21 TaxID=2779369 RepID=UPI0018E8D6A0|nr:ATP-binding cassette domain-containing protein [Alteromonas sp. IB21]MBJ2128707.1 ABC transporter ATP-binding protein [Alteromonas sp. IB21]
MSQPSVSLSLKDVCLTFRTRKGFFRYHQHYALKNVSFQVFKGETLGVIGRNGCGKSTLLKVLAGILKADSGELVSNVNYISLQSLATGFDRQLSGRDNAILSAMLLGHSKEAALNALPSILEFSELGDAFEQPVKSYSSGMRSRLGFSVAMLMEADVLLVDETLGVGDTRFKRKAEKAILSRINSDQTVVFVSHSAGQVKRLCSRVVWLEHGEVKKVGPADILVDEYEEFIQQERTRRNRK